jgi:orotidine-5'-phosphate decarboxylase
VLTSHDAASYARATGRRRVSLAGEVVRQAQEAASAGLAGIVCSAAEIASARRALPDHAILVVPGIRREDEAVGDQVRVATAREAAESGATHLVVGRPVIRAADPAEALRRLLEEARCVAS